MLICFGCVSSKPRKESKCGHWPLNYISIIGQKSVWPPIYSLDFSLTLWICQSLPFVGQQAGLGVECQVLLTSQLLTIKGWICSKDVACCLCIFQSSFCSWPICPNALHQALLTPSQDIEEMPTVSSLGLKPKLDPSQIWRVFFTNLLNLRSCRPNQNRGKKDMPKSQASLSLWVSYIRVSSWFIPYETWLQALLASYCHQILRIFRRWLAGSRSDAPGTVPSVRKDGFFQLNEAQATEIIPRLQEAHPASKMLKNFSR